MVNLPRPRPAPAAPWLVFLLLLPLVASACITVESDLIATPVSSSAPATAAASPTQAPVASPTPTPTPRPTPEPVEAEVLGFVPHWLLDEAAPLIEPELLTVAAFHSVEAAADGSLVSRKGGSGVPPGWAMLRSDRFKTLKGELQAAGVKVVPVIQRTAWVDGTRARMTTLLSKKKNRTALAQNIAAFVKNRGFDGVNLDFEPMPPKLADDYVALVREVRAALDTVDPALHLSVDVVPGLEGYDLAALTADDAADLAVIMGYGYRSASSGSTGSVAPLRDPSGSDLATSVSRALEQTDGEQLLLALPWYGTAWSTDGPEAGAAVRKGKKVAGGAVVDYGQAREIAARNGRAYDPDQAVSATAYAGRGCSSCTPTWRQAWYEDPDSFGAKVDFALGEGLAGVGVWALGMAGGQTDMWWALRNQLQPRFDETAPGGSAALDPATVQGDVDGRAVVSGVAVLRLFASDEADGTGLGYVRIALDDELDEDGRLVLGRTYPATDRVEFPLADPATGGSSDPGPRSVHVQWRDLAGNWSVPIVLQVQALKPARTTTPADL